MEANPQSQQKRRLLMEQVVLRIIACLDTLLCLPYHLVSLGEWACNAFERRVLIPIRRARR